MWLDTDARRLDVAKILRAARACGAQVISWGPTRVEVRDDETLVIGRQVMIELERLLVRAPSTGELVEGPVLARCPRLGCRNRARVLWELNVSAEGDVACRACADIRYASASTSDRAERAMLAHERLRAKLGLANPWQALRRRHGEHRATFERRAAQLDHARLRAETATATRKARRSENLAGAVPR